MLSKISVVTTVTMVATLLGGCAKEPPKCSDDDTVSLVRKIILDQIGGSIGLTEEEIKENMKLDFPRADAFDEKIKKYSCEAKLIAGDMYQLPITYESQLDDKDQHIVSVGGIGRRDLLAVHAGVIEGIKKRRAETSVVTKPAEASPTLKPTEQPTPSVASSGASIEIDVKSEIDLKDGTYLAKEYGGQGRYAFITHNHGRFEGGDIAEAVCTDGYPVTNLPSKFDMVKEILKPTDFVLTKCDEAK